jgi:hypothetical protein
MNAFSVLAIGFLLGLKHATEADHVTAVATLVAGQRSLQQVIRQGVLWGLGHSLMLFSIGFVVLTLGHKIPSHLAQTLECAVGAMLIIMGADVLRRMMIGRHQVTWHRRHSREIGCPLVHEKSQPRKVTQHPGSLRALMVGMVHGMAGSAALIVLSLGAMQSPALAVLYIVIFGIGSIAGMAALSTAMAYPMRLSAKVFGEGQRMIIAGIGAFSCALGATVIYRIAING